MTQQHRLVSTLLFVGCFGAAATFAVDPIGKLETSPSGPFRVSGNGVINDGTHPKRPGDFRKIDVAIRMEIDPGRGLASISVESRAGGQTETDRYLVRHGRIFQVDDKGAEIPAAPLADISPAAVAALHPVLVASAMRDTRSNVKGEGEGSFLFASNDALWTVASNATSGRILRLTRREAHELYGDDSEEVIYDDAQKGVVVRRTGREVAKLTFGPPESIEVVTIPEGDGGRERGHFVEPDDLSMLEIASHVFTIDLQSLNTRVIVAEFADYVVVLEGAYNATVGDELARLIKDTLKKPIRYHAFSHLHGQYIGSARSFIAQGATIIVPPSTAPMIEQMARAPHTLEPDLLAASPRPAKIEEVKTSQRLKDDMNELVIYNVVSEHTDEYFIFWFPGPKILLTGDLLYFRPRAPLSGRSKRLCRTMAELELDPDRLVVTWPLKGDRTKNVVFGADMQAACSASP